MVPDYIIYLIVGIYAVLAAIGLLFQKLNLPFISIKLPDSWSEYKKDCFCVIATMVIVFIMGLIINNYVENYKENTPNYYEDREFPRE
jgi:hypothetical protein